MRDSGTRNDAFEQQLAALRERMLDGLPARGKELEAAAASLAGGDRDARETIGRLVHKLRGIAGSHGLPQVTQRSAEIEHMAASAPDAELVRAARAFCLELTRISNDTRRTAHPTALKGPADPAPPPAPPPRRARITSDRPPPKADGRGLRVLAIDDDPMTLRLLTLTLRQVGGFAASIVSDANQALVKLQAEPFDVVVTDAMMPDLSGLAFCRAARALGGSLQALPIIILSAATAEELGWQDSLDPHTHWLRKPFRPSVLVQQIAAIVGNSPV